MKKQKMTVEFLMNLVMELQDAGEMHGMSVSEAADFFVRGTDATRDMRNEAVERILNGDF